jgi:hypothetical protein
VQRGKEEKSEVAVLSSREIQVRSAPPHGREESSKSCLGLGLFFQLAVIREYRHGRLRAGNVESKAGLTTEVDGFNTV